MLPRFSPPVSCLCLSICLIFFGCLFSGCRTLPGHLPKTKDGKIYGVTKGPFRHKWWNYYERGLSFADGGFFDDALSDLFEAARKRGEDQRMARTYGMHFMDYFPNREIGLIHYLKGDYPAALNALQQSLKQHPSAKARYYIDRVRREIWKKSGEVIPLPQIEPEHESIETADHAVVIAGRVTDAHFVSAIAIEGMRIFMEGAAPAVDFNKTLHLSHGEHNIQIMAVNLMGKTATRDVTVRVDMQGPMITVAQVEHGKDGVKITGNVYDESGIANLWLDNRHIKLSDRMDAPFAETVPPGSRQAVMVAEDQLGNQTRAPIALNRFPAEPVRTKSVQTAPVRTAALMSDARPLSALFGPQDTKAPVIEIKDWPEDTAVWVDKVYIAGQVGDESAIEHLTVNGLSVLRHKGQRVFFNHIIPLNEGENRITVKAQDAHENTSEKVLKIIRNIPKVRQISERLTLSVLPFEEKDAALDAADSYLDHLMKALFDRKRFNLVERARLDAVLQELKLSATDLVDQQSALKTGKLLAAEGILTGTIIKTGTGIEIVGRMIDTETTQIMAIEDVYDEISELKKTDTLAEALAVKLHQRFPLMEGMVVAAKGGDVFTDLGEDRIALQRRLIVYREEVIKHPVSGKILGADSVILGSARVVAVEPEMSKAALFSGEPAGIKPLDKVITE